MIGIAPIGCEGIGFPVYCSFARPPAVEYYERYLADYG